MTTPHNDGKPRELNIKKLTAIALTANGANPHANATFFKSLNKNAGEKGKKKKKGEAGYIKMDENGEPLQKRMLLTSPTDKHVHTVDIDRWVQWDHGGDTSYTSSHSHPFVIDDLGNVQVGEVNGHTHDVENVSSILENLLKSQSDNGDNTMSKDKNADTTMSDELKKMKAEIETLTLVSKMNDGEKVHYETLSDEDKTTFLGKTADQRKEEIDLVELSKKEKLDGETVVFKSAAGTVYTQKDDPRLVEMAKNLDSANKIAAEEITLRKDSDLKKRAETDLQYLPGDEATKVAMLKAVDAIPDTAMRKSALDALKAQNTTLSKSFTSSGTSSTVNVDGETDADAAHAELTKKADKLQEADPTMNAIDAYAKATELNPKLYQTAVG